jgi:chorismate mutase
VAGQALGDVMMDVVLPPQETHTAGLSHHTAEVVRAAQRELVTLLTQRAEIMKRIGAVKQTLAGLASIFDCSAVMRDLSGPTAPEAFVSHPTGLTDACRMALLNAREPLRPHQVRDRLRFQGLSLANHRDPVASVTTVLRRLGQYGEARAVLLPDGKRAWEWVTTERLEATAMPM